MSDGRKILTAPRLILVAALAGALAGAVAVYVTWGPDGNNPHAVADAAAEADRACAAKAGRAEGLSALAVGDVAAMLPADPPRSLAALAFDDPDGRASTIADHAGKTLLVNLWATWCAPCRAEMPALDALQRRMGGDAFEVVAINIDTGDDAKPRAFLSEIGVTALRFYRDATMGVFNDLKRRSLALGLPVTLLVDAEGCLLASMNGPAEWAGDDARKLIEAAVGR
ncbi:MAG TPA: TlpA family protein disulfide reductase [Rhizobiales bacterium]|nr:TlpA family protein disulfide reductase [Hyphomicrobiales bacterium]